MKFLINLWKVLFLTFPLTITNSNFFVKICKKSIIFFKKVGKKIFILREESLNTKGCDGCEFKRTNIYIWEIEIRVRQTDYFLESAIFWRFWKNFCFSPKLFAIYFLLSFLCLFLIFGCFLLSMIKKYINIFD